MIIDLRHDRDGEFVPTLQARTALYRQKLIEGTLHADRRSALYAAVGRVKARPIAAWLAPRLVTYELNKVVLYFVTQPLARLLVMYLRDFQPCSIFPGTPLHKRERKLELWQSRHKRRVLLVQFKCDVRPPATHEFFLEHPWGIAPRCEDGFRLAGTIDELLTGQEALKPPAPV